MSYINRALELLEGDIFYFDGKYYVSKYKKEMAEKLKKLELENPIYDNSKNFRKFMDDFYHEFAKRKIGESTDEYCHKLFHKYLYNYPNKCFTKDEIDRAKFLKKDINRAKHLEKYKYK